jgi:hypothetical protein
MVVVVRSILLVLRPYYSTLERFRPLGLKRLYGPPRVAALIIVGFGVPALISGCEAVLILQRALVGMFLGAPLRLFLIIQWSWAIPTIASA